MASGTQYTRTGSFTSDGNARSIRTLGFRPRKVEVYNVTSGDSMLWIDTMADAAARKQLAAGTASFLTANGITPLSDGFTLGADADVNANGEVLHYVAHE